MMLLLLLAPILTVTPAVMDLLPRLTLQILMVLMQLTMVRQR